MANLFLPDIPLSPMYENGVLSIEWHEFFRSLFERVGGDDTTGLSDLAIAILAGSFSDTNAIEIRKRLKDLELLISHIYEPSINNPHKIDIISEFKEPFKYYLPQTVFDDLNFDPVRSGGPVATRPDSVTINNVFHVEFTSANNQLCGSVNELPHKYKLSSTIYPHIHCFLKSGEAAGTTGVTFTLYWELRQSTGTTSGSVPVSATSAQLTANGNKVDLFDLTGFAGAAELGSQLALTIARTAGDAGDVVVTTYGVHYEIDTVGSRLILSK